jgi:hypothetical protein
MEHIGGHLAQNWWSTWNQWSGPGLKAGRVAAFAARKHAF